MQMMYEMIAQELKSMRISNRRPIDYLNFYSLGNRDNCPADDILGSSDSAPVNSDMVI